MTENSGPDRIRLGMVGGGKGAFIGVVHRIAARLDDHFELVAGALSATPGKAAESARALRLAGDRIYDDYAEMARREGARPDGIQAVVIATPNNLHHANVIAFLDAGIHVICDKPLTVSVAEAIDLQRRAEAAGLVLVVTYNNTGYPMVREARAIVRSGRLGTIRSVQVEYAQDWLTENIEAAGHKQASWRVDPAQTGLGACVGDIGTHAFNLAAFVTGLRLSAVLAEVSTLVPGRAMDDDVNVLLRYANGARGALWASQVAVGNENGLRIRVFGDRGGVEWSGEQPNHLKVTDYGQPTTIVTRGGYGSGPSSRRVTRMPAGHPEGYLECFANIYLDAAELIRAAIAGRAPDPEATLAPQAADGLEAVRFVEAVIASGRTSTWVDLTPEGAS